MEDDVKEDPAKPAGVKFIGKEGWLKKSSGKLLGGYKERYIQVEKTEFVVYENESLEKCIERVDLENYDECHEVKSTFQKKPRLVMIPIRKRKVHDIKLQALTSEEKDDWIKALSEAISRAKNKVFDEVKVDESSSLEHVTRTRPKGNQGRRPPTRIHMKEVASISLEGILRLDLEAVDSLPNGTHQISIEGEAPKEIIKPPMPPMTPKESTEEELGDEPVSQTKVRPPPLPSLKITTDTSGEESNATADDKGKDSPDVLPPSQQPDFSTETDKIAPAPASSPSLKGPGPPMPPCKGKKPALSMPDLVPAEVSDSDKYDEKIQEAPVPPMPPSKEKKPALHLQVPEEHSTELPIPGEPVAIGEDSINQEAPPNPSEEKEEFSVPHLKDLAKTVLAQDSSALEGQNPIPNSNVTETDSRKSVNEVDMETEKLPELVIKPIETSVEHVKKSPGPPTLPKKSLKSQMITTQPAEPKGRNMIPPGDSISSTESSRPVPSEIPTLFESSPEDKVAVDDSIFSSSPSVKEMLPDSKTESFVVMLSDFDTGESSDLLLDEDKMEQDDLRQCDSGQHTEDESESIDNIRASTTALSGSRAHLDEDVSDESSDIQAHAMEQSRLSIDAQANKCFQQRLASPCTFTPEPNLSKSISVGDLLSPTRHEEELSPPSPKNDIQRLHGKVSIELESTKEYLIRLSIGEGISPVDKDGDSLQCRLLAEAVEKLQKAEQFLREAKSLKGVMTKRLSW